MANEVDLENVFEATTIKDVLSKVHKKTEEKSLTIFYPQGFSVTDETEDLFLEVMANVLHVDLVKIKTGVEKIKIV